MASSPQVLCLFGAPDRTSALSAVARTVGLIQRRHALSYVEIARVIECSTDTIERAAREETLLSFDAVARLGYFFNDCADPIKRLFEPSIVEPTTLEDRLQRAETEILTVRRELEAMGRQAAA